MYDSWQTAWTPDWKAWCCENEQRGCPSTTTTTTVTTSTATTTSKEGCDAVCAYHGANATCIDRVHWASTYKTNHKENPCEARTPWSKGCRSPQMPYIAVNQRMRSLDKRWTCPVCSLPLRPDDVITDPYAQGILDTLRGEEDNLEAVVFEEDCTWSTISAVT